MPRVALVTCAEFPVGDPEEALLLDGACANAQVDQEWVPWDVPAVDWGAYDLAVIRGTWDYPQRLEEFLTWARRVPRLANPADVVAWNTAKTYLRDLEGAGVPVVPTQWLEPGDAVTLPVSGKYVVKPAVGAGGRDAARYTIDEEEAARRHVTRLHERGTVVMVQPFMASVVERGETALIFIDGEYSHAVRKDIRLTSTVVDDLYLNETVAPRETSAGEREVADRVLAAVPGGAERLLYARVDLVDGPAGEPMLLELEITEPSLFLDGDPQAADRFAAAIARWAGH